MSAYRSSAVRSYRQPPRKKKKGINMMTVILILGALVIAALVVYLAFFRDRERTVPMTETPLTPGMTRLATNRGLLYQTDGEIHYYDWLDESRNYTYGTADNTIRMSGTSAISGVYTESQLQIVGQSKPIQFNDTGTIESVELGTSHAAILYKGNAGTESIVIVRISDGAQIDQLLPNDQYIIDFGFYMVNKTEMLWIELLSDTAGIPISTVRCYDLSKANQTGAITVQNQLIDDIYITSNSFFISGTNQIIRYTLGDNKEAYRVTDYGYKVLDFSNASGSAVFLLTPRGGDMHSVKLLQLDEADTASAVETGLQLPGEGVAGFIMNNSLVVVSREKMFTYSLKGKLSETAALQYPIENAWKLNDTRLLLESGDRLYIAQVS